MRIGILSRRPDLYSTRRLLEAGKAREHHIEIIDFSRCYMNITSSAKSVHYYGKPLHRLDAIIPRISTNSTFYGCSVVRQLETMGTYTINPSIAITRSRDKLRSLQILSMHNMGMPITGFANSTADIQDLIKMIGGTPLIIKVLEGTQGVGVVLAETKKAAESVIQAFLGTKQNIIIQEFIKEAKGADIRCLVVGERVIAAMKRTAAPGEFRSNIHRGGVAELVEITKEERATATKAAKIMGLKLAGVDLLRSDRGPLVMEVNSSPGLEGIETATGEDVAGQVIEYLEKHAKPMKKGSRYEG